MTAGDKMDGAIQALYSMNDQVQKTQYRKELHGSMSTHALSQQNQQLA